MNCPECMMKIRPCPSCLLERCGCPGAPPTCDTDRQHWHNSKRTRNRPTLIDFTEPVREKRQGWHGRT